ncbi:MAG: ATP-binding protein [Elusimicrobia bacterium]|nr:ATP-binding protein [Elusimicrobiota bacterium]
MNIFLIRSQSEIVSLVYVLLLTVIIISIIIFEKEAVKKRTWIWLGLFFTVYAAGILLSVFGKAFLSPAARLSITILSVFFLSAFSSEFILNILKKKNEFLAEDKKIMEALVLAKEEADFATKAKSEFLANMSHEIRTPLNSIIGIADLFAETKLTDQQKEYVSILKKSGDTLLSLINDILDLSKIEAKKMALYYTNFNLEEIIQQILEIFQVHASQKGITLEYNIEKNVVSFLIGDANRLRQILINLVGNAVKFTQKGKVSIKAGNYELKKNEATILFCVEDTGIGIPEDKLHTVFESFAQADSSTTRKYGGTGLGLAISDQLVHLMGGKIWIESKESAGSRFFFTAGFKYQDELMKCDSKTVDGHIIKVLVIDKDKAIRERVANALGKNGLIVSETENEKNAVSELAETEKGKNPYDVLFIGLEKDISSDMSSLLRTIRQDLKLKDLKIVVMLQERTPEILSRMHLIDAQYIFKPILYSYLFRAIDSIVKEKNEQIVKHQKEAEYAAPKKKLNILLAEDSEDNRALIGLYLRDGKHNIDMAEDGEIAVKKFKENKYDIVIMDLHMPVKDGLEAIRDIRKHEAETLKKHTPIVALTADVLREVINKSIEAGSDMYITKPLKKATLLEVISKYSK